MTELDALRVTTVFTADPKLNAWIGKATLIDGDLHKLADAGLIECGEGVLLEDLVLSIRKEEVTHVVTTDAERSLSEIVSSEAEELRSLSNLICRQCSAWHFNHRADEVVELNFLFLHHLLRNIMHDCDLKVEFFLEANQRNHHFGFYLDAFFGNISSSFKDRACLHLGDFRIRNAETATAMSEHWIELMQRIHTCLNLLHTDAGLGRKIFLLSFGVWEELMKRWVKKTDRRRQSLERLKDSCEVFSLVRKQLAECCATIFLRGGEDHLTHGVDAVTFKEHVLCAGESDALCAESDRVFGLLWIVGIGADLELGCLGAPVHELLEAFQFLGCECSLITLEDSSDDFGRGCFQFATVNDTARSIDGHEVTFLEGLAGNGNSLLVVVDVQSCGTADANLAHLTGNECSV